MEKLRRDDIKKTVSTALLIGVTGTVFGLVSASYLVGFWIACMLVVIVKVAGIYLPLMGYYILVGGLTGAIVGILWTSDTYWLLIVGGATGALSGGLLAYDKQRKRQRRSTEI